MNSILALDFDGVIGDSLPECYYSSALSFNPNYDPNDLLAETLDPSPRYQKFCHWRPFVRSGEDYVLIQHMLEKYAHPTSQEDMDSFWKELGEGKKQLYKSKIYEVREELLKENAPLWLKLTPLFSCVSPFLKKLAQNSCVYILSTKKPIFIEKILASHDIYWDESRILEASGESKLEVMDRHFGPDAFVLFVDDQPDHFINLPSRVEPWLPTWGYILPEWLRSGNPWKILQEDKLEPVLRPWL